MVKFVSKKLSVIILFVLFSSALLAANKEYKKMHESHHGSHGNHKHDEVNMPGLQGKDTTEAEVNDLKNIYNLNSNQQYLTKGIREHSTWVQNLNWQDSDVGAIWLAPKSNNEIHIRTCFKLPCSTVACMAAASSLKIGRPV